MLSYLGEFDIPCRLLFSGSKGFHVYFDFCPLDLNFPKETWRSFLSFLSGRLRLRTIDFNVVDLRRLARIPLTTNSKSGDLVVYLDPDKFLRLDFLSFLGYRKDPSFLPEVRESKEVAKLLLKIDEWIAVKEFAKELAWIRYRRTRKGKRKKKIKDWKEKLIEKYKDAMIKYGRFTADPSILEKHTGASEGESEHKARVYFTCLCFEKGMDENEILEVFRHAEDFNEKKSKYYISKIKEWLKAKEVIK